MITTKYIDHMGNDLSVVNAARVSFGKKNDMAYLWGRATTAAGFLGFDGVSYYSFDGKDLANSSQIEHVHFGQPPQGN